MKPNFLKIIPPIENSLVIKTDRALATPWHYHPEIELLYCIKGKGTDYIGNNIQGIVEGELIMCGENLPHTRLGDKEYYEKNPFEKPEAIVVQFKKDFLGEAFFKVKEFTHIHELFVRASKGLRFIGSTKKNVGKRLVRIRELEGIQAVLELLSILDELAKSQQYRYFNSVNYIVDCHEKSFGKINKVYKYTISNFHKPISLDTIAELTHHSKAAFCRFFKAHTRKTYFEYLNEIRIANACRLLREGNHDVTRACYASGFNNLSYFRKQFKKITGTCPTHYKQDLLAHAS